MGTTTLWADESYPYLMIFTGDGLADVERRSIAVEPMTCAPNAFRSGEGLVRLEPGGRHVASWGSLPTPRESSRPKPVCSAGASPPDVAVELVASSIRQLPT